MAKNKVEIVVDADTKKATKKIGKFQKTLKGFGKVAKNAIGVAMGIGLAKLPGLLMEGGRALNDFVYEGAKIEDVSNAFEGLSGNAEETLAALTEGSLGLVGSTDLMKTYNNAAQLVSKTFADDLPDAMGFLSKVSASTGESMDFLLDSLVTGVGRLSPMILDNLKITVNLEKAYADWAAEMGVTVDEMSKADQQAALMAQTMELLAENTANLPDIQDSLSTALARGKIEFQNVKDTIAVGLVPVFTALLDKWDDVKKGIKDKLAVPLALAKEKFEEARDSGATFFEAILEGAKVFAGELIKNAFGEETYNKIVGFWEQLVIGVQRKLALLIVTVIDPLKAIVQNFIDNIWPEWRDAGIEAWEELKVKIEELWPDIETVLDAMIAKLKVDTVEAIDKTKETWKAYQDAQTEWIRFWEEHLKPALEGLLESLGFVIGEQTTLKDAVKDSLEPFGKFNQFLDDVKAGLEDATETLEMINDVLDRVKEAFALTRLEGENFLAWLARLVTTPLPDFLRGHSPPPLATSLREISAALNEMPDLGRQMVGAGYGGAGSTTHNDNWNLTINTQATSEDVAYSYDMMRAMAGA